jgi:hypothetical protein
MRKRTMGGIPNPEDYCQYTDGRLAMDWVADGDRYYRCSVCNKRLLPKEVMSHFGTEFIGWRLPRHKPKGHKIAKIKARQHKMRRKK